MEKVREQLELNVFGVMNVIRELLPHFRKKKRGLILNVSSGAGAFALPVISLYCASTFAVEGFSESSSYELASQNIRIKIIEPGGALSTNFGKRSGEEAAQTFPLKDYEVFVARTSGVFAKPRSLRTATEEDVARVVFEAATEGAGRLRHVATSDVEPLAKARRETCEEEYMASMRSQLS